MHGWRWPEVYCVILVPQCFPCGSPTELSCLADTIVAHWVFCFPVRWWSTGPLTTDTVLECDQFYASVSKLIITFFFCTISRNSKWFYSFMTYKFIVPDFRLMGTRVRSQEEESEISARFIFRIIFTPSWLIRISSRLITRYPIGSIDGRRRRVTWVSLLFFKVDNDSSWFLQTTLKKMLLPPLYTCAGYVLLHTLEESAVSYHSRRKCKRTIYIQSHGHKNAKRPLIRLMLASCIKSLLEPVMFRKKNTMF